MFGCLCATCASANRHAAETAANVCGLLGDNRLFAMAADFGACFHGTSHFIIGTGPVSATGSAGDTACIVCRFRCHPIPTTSTPTPIIAMINRFILAFRFAARRRRVHTFHQTMRNPRGKGLRDSWNSHIASRGFRSDQSMTSFRTGLR